MTHSYAESPTLTCPSCQHLFDAEVYLIVDLAARPDLAARLRAGTLHTCACPHCGHEVELDAPVLVYAASPLPLGEGPGVRVLFSPAQNTTTAQDHEHAGSLLAHLRESLGDAWQDDWLDGDLPGIPRALLPTVLNGELPSPFGRGAGGEGAALQAMLEQVQQELERLRQEDPERFAELEAAARQMVESAGEGESGRAGEAAFEGTPEEAQALADKLADWIRQETLGDAETYLRQHEAELLTEKAAVVMQWLVRANPQNPDVRDHQNRLARAREVGIAAMYAEIRQQRQRERLEELPPALREVMQELAATGATINTPEDLQRLLSERPDLQAKMVAAMGQSGLLQQAIEQAISQAGPIGAAVWRFIQADDEEAAALLQTESALLLTLDAGELLRQLSEVALPSPLGRGAGGEGWGEDFAARLAARREQQQAARLGSGGGRATFAQPGQQVGAQTNVGDGRGTLLSGHFEEAATVGARYEIGVANFSAIGDNAVTLNVLNFGAVTLRWQRLSMTRADLTERAVGRQDELDKLRAQLRAAPGNGDDVAIVGKSRSQAVEGMPGVGKSTLAALYAAACAADPDAYPGGVLWLQLGPSYTDVASVHAALSALVALVYGGGDRPFALDTLQSAPQTLEQIQRALQNALFSAEAIGQMLAGHGRLLVVVDDLWERALWPDIRRMLPAEAHILVTTRDDRVARAVGHTLPLDVLTLPDALRLIAQELPQMPEALAQRLIRIVGAHPMALRIILGDLHPDDPPAEWSAALDRIADRLARGLGVDPTALDDIEPERRLSAVFAYSYAALAHSEPLQRCFRALGCFAPDEAEFPTAAVGAVLATPEAAAREWLKTLRDRNLLRRVAHNDRWQQHALLRSYALEQQSAAERLTWAERHARYYLAHMQAADDAQTYYTMRPDLPNLRHAFAWAAGEGRALGLAQALLSNCANLLQSQNLGLEYLAWAEQVKALAFRIGGTHEQGQALTSLGNALQAAATLGNRGARLRAALAAYDEALDKLRAVPLDYAQTQNNRANVLSDLASLPGEDRGARLRAALAAYDEALDKLRDVPLAYATTQNNRAVLLRDLASLPGEDRGARLRAALADAAAAVFIFEQVQHVQYLQIARGVLAGVMVAIGLAEVRAVWSALTDQPFPMLPAELLLSALAEQAGIGSQEEFLSRLQHDAAFRQQVKALAAFAQSESRAPDEAQALADLLIAWIQTPDWGASETFLQAHAADLLTDQAAAVLELLRQGNPNVSAIPQHQTLLRRCREIGIAAAYRER